MPEAEGMALYDAGLVVAPRRLGPLLEIGTYCGKSAAFLGAAARQTGTVLFSVDHHRGSEEMQPGWPHHDPDVVDPVTGMIDTLPFARRTLQEAGLEATVVLVVGDSVQVARAWGEQLSLLFIDGGHGAGVAWADYRSWAPKVAVSGTLALHDVFADPAEGGQVPYEIFCHARESGEWEELAAVGSLRLLRRAQVPSRVVPTARLVDEPTSVPGLNPGLGPSPA
jgi:hypothetical protein